MVVELIAGIFAGQHGFGRKVDQFSGMSGVGMGRNANVGVEVKAFLLKLKLGLMNADQPMAQ